MAIAKRNGSRRSSYAEQEWMRDLCVRLTMAHVASSHLMFYAVAKSFVQRFAVEKEINDLTAAIH